MVETGLVVLVLEKILINGQPMFTVAIISPTKKNIYLYTGKCEFPPQNILVSSLVENDPVVIEKMKM